MTRPANPAPQFFDDENNILVGGRMFYFRSGTSDPIVTYADNLESKPNTHPIILDSAGRLPNVFFTGSAKQVLQDTDGNQIWERDPVGDQTAVGDFTPWNALISYDIPDKVIGSDNKVYQSLQNNNQGNDPTLNPGSNSNWEEISFLRAYNSSLTYNQDDIVVTSDGTLWTSSIDNNTGNTPTVGDSNWMKTNSPSNITDSVSLHFYRNS